MDAMKDFLIRWLVLTVAAAVMVVLLPGMTAVGQPPILGIAVFALFMALINASIKPVTQLIALPFFDSHVRAAVSGHQLAVHAARLMVGNQSVRCWRVGARVLVGGARLSHHVHCLGDRRQHRARLSVGVHPA